MVLNLYVLCLIKKIKLKYLNNFEQLMKLHNTSGLQRYNTNIGGVGFLVVSRFSLKLKRHEMEYIVWLDQFSFIVLFGAVVLSSLASLEIGYRLGQYRRKQASREKMEGGVLPFPRACSSSIWHNTPGLESWIDFRSGSGPR